MQRTEMFTFEPRFVRSPRSSEKIAKILYSDVISNEMARIFEVVNFVGLCCVIGFLGIIANIINISIFYKQGFNNTVNIAFFGLALSDLCCLTMLLWVSVCMNPVITTIYKQRWIQPEVMYISGAWPHICFCRITSFITVYVTAERFLCILLPLRVKEIITPRKTVIILVIIYAVNLATLIPEYSTAYLHWKFVPETNRTLYGLFFTSSRESVEGMCYVLHSMLGMTSFAAVIFFTTALVIKLSQSSKWRRNATSTNNQHESLSARDKKTVKMIVVIAIILIICYTPGAIIALTTFVVGTDFDIMGRYVNICEATWSIAFPVQAINSSINIFMYYSMSSRYRQTLREIISLCRGRDVEEVLSKSK